MRLRKLVRKFVLAVTLHRFSMVHRCHLLRTNSLRANKHVLVYTLMSAWTSSDPHQDVNAMGQAAVGMVLELSNFAVEENGEYHRQEHYALDIQVDI